MKGEEFLEKLEFIDPELIEKAEEKPKNKNLKWIFSAAAIIFLVFMIPVFTPEKAPVEPGDSAPWFTLSDGREFFVSSYADAISNELPEGFEYSGETNAGGYENVPFYTNPDIPEWAYVYQTVYSNGELDSFGTLIPTEPHEAYLRYVDIRIRGAQLVNIDGEHFISMWSVRPYGKEPDITAEYYDYIEATYGIMIEGEPPEGFAFLGKTEFSGHDTVPKENLHSNYGVFDVYASPSEPDVIFVSTHWYTHTSEEKAQTRHDGFDVYIKYDCPFG
ncbi:MAG: hypothetical protein IKL18_06000 [Oscillospiraceae bacterium]|nr:hypothetical protein [Oscillospiraceae bacterium]MBR6657703.1 hypothetical protein [Oscillospiraceae bacterium]